MPALLAAGVVMTLLGLRWLAGHIPNRAVGQLELPGSGPDGRLLVAAGTVASAAAAAFAATPGVRSAKGTIHRDRGQLVAKLTATVEHEADLHLVAAAADTVTADLRQALQRDDMVARVQLHAAGRNRALPRVSWGSDLVCDAAAVDIRHHPAMNLGRQFHISSRPRRAIHHQPNAST